MQAMAATEAVISLLQTVSACLDKSCERFLTSTYNLTTPQYQLLLAVAQGEEITLGALSEQLHCSRGNVTGIVDRLERDGWLVRERNTRDRRVITVYLTEKGTGVEEIRLAVSREMGRLARVWDAEERNALRSMLSRLYRELCAG